MAGPNSSLSIITIVNGLNYSIDEGSPTELKYNYEIKGYKRLKIGDKEIRL